ncbi:MAG: hypothetical protein ACLP5H_15460, partial [Desulfomonilaceae bacterium]
VFSLLEERDFFRMKVRKSEVNEDHVEEFMDKTVEWLSTNPQKGILIDFEGVKSVCSDAQRGDYELAPLPVGLEAWINPTSR